MKRILAFVMIFMLLCGSALATDVNTSLTTRQDATRWTSGSQTNPAESTTAQTELWLKVEAKGQIDVTVPLVLVFQTNIEGGAASQPTNYKITNHSSADLVVTTIQVNVKKQDAVPYKDDSNPMTLVSYTKNAHATNEYGVQLAVGEQTDIKGNPRAAYTADVTYIDKSSDNKTTRAANLGGIFLLPRGKATTVTPSMKTGELSFVTKTDSPEKGVHLLTLIYTVAIDSFAAIGEEITTAPSTGTTP